MTSIISDLRKIFWTLLLHELPNSLLNVPVLKFVFAAVFPKLVLQFLKCDYMHQLLIDLIFKFHSFYPNMGISLLIFHLTWCLLYKVLPRRYTIKKLLSSCNALILFYNPILTFRKWTPSCYQLNFCTKMPMSVIIWT